MKALQVRTISKSFDGKPAVRNLSFSLEKGEILGLVGPNGAGKTTTMRIVSGLLEPDSGDVLFGDTTPASGNRKHRLGWVPQNLAFYPELTVGENLTFFGNLYELSEKRLESRSREVLEVFGLTELKNQVSGTLSGGYQRRLNLALGVIHEPEVLILDEPAVGIDSASRRLILSYLTVLGRGGCSLLLSSHYTEEIWPICDRVALLVGGELVCCEQAATFHAGLPDEIRVLSGPLETESLTRLGALKGLLLTSTPKGADLRIQREEEDEGGEWLRTLSEALLELRQAGATIHSFNAGQIGFEPLVASDRDTPRWSCEKTNPKIGFDMTPIRSAKARHWPVGLVLVLLVLCLMAISWTRTEDSTRYSLQVPQNEVGGSVPSPDGKSLAFLRTGSIFVQNVDRGEALELKETARAGEVFVWSPDSRQIAFVREYELWRIAVADGSAFRVCSLPEREIKGVNWGPSDSIVFRSEDGVLYGVTAAGGKPSVIVP